MIKLDYIWAKRLIKPMTALAAGAKAEWWVTLGWTLTVSLPILFVFVAFGQAPEQKKVVQNIEEINFAPLRVYDPQFDVRFLSKLKVSHSYTHDLDSVSDLSPTIDTVADIFIPIPVKDSTQTPAEPGFTDIIDSLIMSYIIPKERESEIYRQQFLQEIPSGYPLEFKGVTSPFGVRIHPIYGNKRKHKGVDLRAAFGTPIVSTADGVVEFAGVREDKSGAGLLVVMLHNYGFRTNYGHLQQILVERGSFIKKGEVIAMSGDSGNADGPHLHYGVTFLQKAIDPKHFVNWGDKTFNSIFKADKDIKWPRLVELVNSRLRRPLNRPLQLVKK